jgi:CheY-like chemotaxis protein
VRKKGEALLANALAIRALVVSSDRETIGVLSQVMGQSAIHVEVSPSVDSAIRELCQNKYEAVVIDFQNQQDSLALVRKQRTTTSNRSAVVWGIVNSDKESSEAFRAGANFVVVRPLSQSTLGRTLKVSYPLMVREKRRYHRTSMEVQVFVNSSSHPEFMANSINISEGGMALDGSVPVQVGERLTLRFKMPETNAAIKLTGEVCWYDHEGRVGFQFVMLSDQVKEQIQVWIAERLDASLAKVGLAENAE